jgi:site-specific DNA-methyltransferase (cytosine-N4-specific)
MKVVFRTKYGKSFHGSAEDILQSSTKRYAHKVNLIFTSPPFPLIRKKSYGNLAGQAYVDWIASFAIIFKELLAPNGSLVIEMGNVWEPGQPTMSTIPINALLKLINEGKFYLCQQFIWFNPTRLPSPAQWVNVERMRVKDAFTHIWWLSGTDKPKANNRNVLVEYSESMKRLLKTRKYNSGKRPSEHDVGKESFLIDNKGAIPSNVLTFANTRANSRYLSYCRSNSIKPHPARMPIELPRFFIKFLTDPDDLVLDPFAGSNTTGAAAEELKRHWIAIETEEEYILGSKGHFQYIIDPKNWTTC